MPDLLAHYRARFRHVLVDEFQDTNTIQYAWLKLLAGATGVPFVVGDDDQSIYRWRGARVENLQQFRRDFPGAQLFRLEQNYRSTGKILGAANALIATTPAASARTCGPSGGKGEPIRLYGAFNERDEADFVVDRIRDWVARGGDRARRGDPLPLERAVARLRRGAARGAHSLPRLRRPAVLRARGDQGRARVPAADRQPRRRRVVRARRQPADARHRRAHARDAARDMRKANELSLWRAATACTDELGAKAAASLQASSR